MTQTLAFIHTSATLVPVFQKLCDEKLPGIQTFHLSDDSLIKDVIAHGRLTAATAQRVALHVFSAESAGADRILVTCSSIGTAVEAAALLTGVPVHRVDQPMADEAVRLGSRIGVIATLPTTLEPTTDLVKRRAALAGREVQLVPRLCDGAFDALMSGDLAKHDQMVAAALQDLMNTVEVILLAQASMARVLEQMPTADRRIPILSSPGLAMDFLARQVAHPEE